MIYVVDFEGYFVKNNFVIKEFAYFRLHGSKSEQFLFQAPFSWSALTFKEKQTVSYCEKFLHRIRWSSGNIPYQNRHKIFNNIFQKGDFVFVKGDQKVKVFQRYLSSEVKVKNLESYNCPKIANFLPSEVITCSLPRHKENIHCAHLKVKKYASFLRGKSLLDHVSLY